MSYVDWTHSPQNELIVISEVNNELIIDSFLI